MNANCCTERKQMPQKIVIIGAVALGPKAACRFKRLEPESNVVMLDKGDLISYGGCGIPYYVSGDVSDVTQLQTTSFHMVRDVEFFRKVKGVTALTRTEAVAIDRRKKQVMARSGGQEVLLPYDKLVLGTGSCPRRIPVPGADLDNVFTIAGLHEAVAIRERVTAGQVERAVVIGAGFIGLELTEALSDMWGIETTLIEVFDQVMPNMVGKEMAGKAREHLEEKGVQVLLGEKVLRLEGEAGVRRVVTDKRELSADLVIMAVGVQPCISLAENAGLEIAANGAIAVNRHMQTSDPEIFAGGDCVAVPNLITGRPGYFPLGSMANRQGRVIGSNLHELTETFDGAVGSFVVKVFDISLAGAGLSLSSAKAAGFDAVSVQMAQLDRAHFYPTRELMYLELVVERNTRRVLGIQGLGGSGDAMVGRINSVAPLLAHKPTVSDISNLELAYSPPFTSAMDIVNALGNVADNVLSGRYHPISEDEFRVLWDQRENGDVYFLDCRALADSKPLAERNPGVWNAIPQDELRERIDEVPEDRRVVLVCNTGVRAYEAQLNLRELGRGDTLSVQGGMASLKKSGFNI